jgi:hypothetical protein
VGDVLSESGRRGRKGDAMAWREVNGECAGSMYLVVLGVGLVNHHHVFDAHFSCHALPRSPDDWSRDSTTLLGSLPGIFGTKE